LNDLDRMVSSYDDLFVFVESGDRLVLECPACGFIPIPLRETTLSDLTNAAMDHLSERHPYTLTLPSSRSAAPATSSSTRDGAPPSGYFTDHFWSLIALLADSGAGIEVLVRTLASSGEDEILAFQEQLMNAIALLDTPAHRIQKVRDLDDALQTVPSAMSDDVFAKVRLAVVASGRDVWLEVLAAPSRLAAGWSLQAAEALLDVPAAALRRTTTSLTT